MVAGPRHRREDFRFREAIGSRGFVGGDGSFTLKPTIRKGPDRLPQLFRDTGKSGDGLLLVVGSVASMIDRSWKLQRYERKDYSELVEFPVEIVGRDGVVRRYSFEDSIRLYQRRISFAPVRSSRAFVWRR